MANELPTYVSLFSSGGLGCYGFKLEQYKCIATAELLPRRMEVQKANNVCDDQDGYILGDLTLPEIKARLNGTVDAWKYRNPNSQLTVVLATPPCQGMSVANHKKGDETARNSLVVESLSFISRHRPKFFVLENVRSFLKTLCEDVDGISKPISEAIDSNLGPHYNIANRTINFKDFGAQSSRTRTLVIGVRKDLQGLTPWDLYPEEKQPKLLWELIGDLPRLNQMGEICPSDIYHSFKSYDPRMRPWIASLGPGENAFENADPLRRPHKIVDGQIIQNKAGNSDKYKRNLWDKVAPCVHTRNDILASQSTVHPEDDRVFSIRELCRMMGVHENFRWSPFSLEELNQLPVQGKEQYLRENETNIRQCLGEGVPTPIVQSVASRIKQYIENDQGFLAASQFLRNAELQNPRKEEDAAFYTRLDIASNLLIKLPNFENKKTLRVLEPSVGAGVFIKVLAQRYPNHQLIVDAVDLNPVSLKLAEEFVEQYVEHNNLTVNYVESDFSQFSPGKNYDLIIGNPPFGKIPIVNARKDWGSETNIKDLFALFLQKSLAFSDYVALVIPKLFLGAPEYAQLRKIIEDKHIYSISDFGELAFSDIKIETIGLVVSNKNVSEQKTIIDSYPLGTRFILEQSSLYSNKFPGWLIYRNHFFDQILNNLQLDVFEAFRDRELSSKAYSSTGTIRVFRAADIPRNSKETKEPVYLKPGIYPSSAESYIEKFPIFVAPNLSYYPRMTALPPNTVVDGSAAVLVPKIEMKLEDLAFDFYSSDIFFYFYRIARNYSTRTLNIDTNAVKYWGVPIPESNLPVLGSREPTSKELFKRPADLKELLEFRSGGSAVSQ